MGANNDHGGGFGHDRSDNDRGVAREAKESFDEARDDVAAATELSASEARRRRIS